MDLGLNSWSHDYLHASLENSETSPAAEITNTYPGFAGPTSNCLCLRTWSVSAVSVLKFLLVVKNEQLHGFPFFKISRWLTDAFIFSSIDTGCRLHLHHCDRMKGNMSRVKDKRQLGVLIPHLVSHCQQWKNSKGSTQDTLQNVVFSTFNCNRVFTSVLGKQLSRRFGQSSLFARIVVVIALQMEVLPANNCTDIFSSALFLSCHSQINKSLRAGNGDQVTSDD